VPSERFRAIDLAQSAGISVQQLRNYVDLGLVPPVDRTASGYRVFTAEHAAALAVVRQMADGHGWKRTGVIMRAAHAADVETVLAELDRSHGELDRERADIERVLGAFEAVVASPVGAGRPAGAAAGSRPPVGRRIGEVAAAIGVRTSALRLWEQRGLLRPRRERYTGYRVYDEAESRRAQVVALLRRGGYPFPIVHAVLDELRDTGSPERVRAELARREQELHRRSLRRLRASAALYGYLQRLGLA
jgi:DNA-binding transcriptional MerR regulator